MGESNLVRWIEEAAKNDAIEAVVIGPFGWGDWGDLEDGFREDGCPVKIPKDKRGVVLPWDEAKKLLDYDFDSGFGSAECHAIYAWSASLVMWIHEYDGSTHLMTAPRNPIACKPTM